MATIIFEGEEIAFCDNGYLIDSSKWTRRLAVKMAHAGGFEKLGADKRHWSVLELLRRLYQKEMLPSKEGEIIFLIAKGTGMSIAKLHRMFEGVSIPKLLKWAGLPATSCPLFSLNNC